MTEQVTDCKLFHLTETKTYKQAFAADQQVKIGEADNPFFGFYENAREYDVSDNGQLIKVKAVAYLKGVWEKRLNTSQENLAKIAYDVTQHYVMLCRELIMEEIRRAEFNSEPPSRQRCLYACDTLKEAQGWKTLIGEGSTICELTCTGTIHRADSRLLLKDSEPLSVTRDRARAYWRGEASADPRFETLFVGDAKITGFGL